MIYELRVVIGLKFDISNKNLKYLKYYKVMSANAILSSNAERLGLRDTDVLKKAEVFLRIFQSNLAAKTINDVAKAILCLDLAATAVGVRFDKVTACKLSGLKNSVYQNNLNNVSKILHLDKPITTLELCVQFSCTEVKQVAEGILTSYQAHDNKIKDINHPQYAAVAVYTACKIHGIKLDKTQFRTISRLKLAQWNELVDEFLKFTESSDFARKTKIPKADMTEVEMMESKEYCNKKEDQEAIEPYEVWRERILREATTEILKSAIAD